MKISWKTFFATLGPGLSMAGAAVGVSHLVQSTRAGASFGLSLILLIIATNILKYPFFEFGHRYAYSTGENLLDGLKRLGPKTIRTYIILNIFTGIATNAGVFLVTCGLIQTLIPYRFPHDTLLYTGILFALLGTFILIGQFALFDKIMKWMMVVLSTTTIIALIMAFMKGNPSYVYHHSPSPWHLSSLPFLLALMGWMPAPIEVSTWQSIWCLEKKKQLEKANMLFNPKWAMNDFRLGYLLTIILAIVFVCLGALLFFHHNIPLEDSAVGFSAQVISMFTQLMGGWSRPMIALCCISTMVSTALTCYDGYSRMFVLGLNSIDYKYKNFWDLKKSLVLFSLPSIVLLIFLGQQLKLLIDFVTTLSFLAAPIFSYWNLKMICLDHVPESAKPSKALLLWCWMGIVFLAAISIVYLVL